MKSTTSTNRPASRKGLLLLPFVLALALPMAALAGPFDSSECLEGTETADDCADCCIDQAQSCLQKCGGSDPGCEACCEQKAGSCEVQCTDNMDIDFFSVVLSSSLSDDAQHELAFLD